MTFIINLRNENIFLRIHFNKTLENINNQGFQVLVWLMAELASIMITMITVRKSNFYKQDLV